MSRRVSHLRRVRRFSRLFAVLVAVVAVAMSTVAPVEVATASASMSTSSTLARSSADPAQSGIAKTSLTGFKPGNIMSNAVFTDEKTMSATQIQSFLNSKVSKCVSGYTCLKDLKVATQTKSADGYCSKYAGSSKESAARIIYKVAQACDLNPQVLLVMLQKEQGLVTHVWPSAWRYNAAMGQACPDTAPCDVAFAGFFAQVYGAARQMQIYLEGKWFQWYKAGNTWQIQYHPDRDRCGTSPVYIANKATEALYYYTPYQPNASALRAGYGEGDSCGSYGNRNFYNYFTDWFGSTQKPSNSECAPPPGGTKVAKYGYVVKADRAAVRTSARNGCDVDVHWVPAGTVVQAVQVTASGDWLQVQTEWGRRWIKHKSVQRASSAQMQCKMAAAADPAKLTYVITRETPARVAPRSGCSTDAVTLEKGAAFTAVAVSRSGLWLKVATESGDRWIVREDTRKASGNEARCVVPSSAKDAKYAYVASGDVPLRTGPNAACGTVGAGLKKGTAVRAVSSTGEWLKVIAGDTQRWVKRDEMRRATTAEGVCVPHAGQVAAFKTYITTGSSTARIAPNTACGKTTSTVKAGTVVTAIAATAERDWLLVDLGTSEKWLPRGDLAYETQAESVCSNLADAATAAKFAYVTTKTTAARVGPAEACGNDGQTVKAGQVVRATGVSGDWLHVRVNGDERWIKRADTRRASTAEAVCVPPSVLEPAKLSYVVSTATTGRIAPDIRCAQGTSSIDAGVRFMAEKVTADRTWLGTTINGQEVWVPRDAVRKATSLELRCPAPSDTKSAYKTYVVLDTGTTLRTAPTTGCDIETSELQSGTVVTASAVTADGAWLQVDVGSGPVWIARADVRYATSADTMSADTTCTHPTDAGTAKLWYRTTAETTGRRAPSEECTDGAETIESGSVLQAERVTAEWLELRVGTATRWVLRSDLEKVPTATTTASLNVRASASTSSQVVTTLASGTIVAVLVKSGEWWQVQTAGGAGWVKPEYLR